MPNADIARSEIVSPPLSASLRKDRILGMALMVTAATGFSLAGVLARQTETTAWEVVFWRSAFMVLVVGAVLIAQHRLRALAKIRAIGWAGLISASFLAASFFCFILAIKNTTVANTVVIMSAAPFVTAATGWLVLGEKVPPRTWIALAAACSGIALMFWESLATGTGLLGNIFAFGIAVTYAGQVTPLRLAGAGVDMIPSALLAGLMAILVALPLSWPLPTSGHGPSDMALVGGAIVLAALAGNALAGSRRGAA